MCCELGVCRCLGSSFGPWYACCVTDESFELKVRLISEAETGWYNELMAGHHSLERRRRAGVLRDVAEAGGVPVVLGTFGSAAWRVPVRDAHLGWDEEQRRARLERVCCNQRLCVLPCGAGGECLAGAGRDAPGGAAARR